MVQMCGNKRFVDAVLRNRVADTIVCYLVVCVENLNTNIAGDVCDN